MNYKPCLLIPIYNHKETIRDTVAALERYQLPMYVVDDGSDAATQATLAAVAAEFKLLRLFRLPVNSGKGAAVIHGMRQAYADGHTHALQIDADGQHSIDDVAKFLERGAANSAAVICGTPIYDASIPKSRLYGRYVTHFWVRIETLSGAIGDSMCGFRLYPLAAACAVIDDSPLPKRMAFDTAILVRLFWRGVPIINLPTPVVYPQNGRSHFRLWRDNVGISMMHTGLVFGMLLRLPVLLGRRRTSGHPVAAHWPTLAERGGALGLRTFFVCYRLFGERVARWLLYPIVAYFFLTGRTARVASQEYLRRVHSFGGKTEPEPGWRDSFAHMLAFGRSSLDKLSAWVGRLDDSHVEFTNQQEFDRLVASGRGAVLIGSHLGNLEMTRALAAGKQAKGQVTTINAVVYTQHAQRFNSVLAQANERFGVNLIQVSDFGPDTAILLKEKIDCGELVVIVGDRTPPVENGRVNGRKNGRVSFVDFLGERAPFAQGPFILACLLDCPVYLFFCLREQDKYRIYLEPFAERITLPRKERLQRLEEYLQQYAQRLAVYCLKAPYQWFNFYDFWRSSAASKP